jgi:hypothetical protein
MDLLSVTSLYEYSDFHNFYFPIGNYTRENIHEFKIGNKEKNIIYSHQRSHKMLATNQLLKRKCSFNDGPY